MKQLTKYEYTNISIINTNYILHLHIYYTYLSFLLLTFNFLCGQYIKTNNSLNKMANIGCIPLPLKAYNTLHRMDSFM